MNFWLLALAFVVPAMVSGCNSDGACVSAPESYFSPECKDDMSEDACKDLDAKQTGPDDNPKVHWSWHKGESCKDLGF